MTTLKTSSRHPPSLWTPTGDAPSPQNIPNIPQTSSLCTALRYPQDTSQTPSMNFWFKLSAVSHCPFLHMVSNCPPTWAGSNCLRCQIVLGPSQITLITKYLLSRGLLVEREMFCILLVLNIATGETSPAITPYHTYHSLSHLSLLYFKFFKIHH